MTATVKDILHKKGSKVVTVLQENSVYEALSLMKQKNIGVLPVTNRMGKVVGIVSYEDFVQKVILDDKPGRSTPVSKIMTKDLISTTLEKTAEECIAVMLEERIKHLPVFDENKLVGLISIGDTVKSIVKRQRVEIKQLNNYITGSYV